MNPILKIFITAGIIVAVNEISKRSTLLGAILISLPIMSILAMIWIYIDTKDLVKISNFSYSVFWFVIPSLVLFIVLPLLIKLGWNFYLSLLVSCAVMFVCYLGMVKLLDTFFAYKL